jgi:ketosteroid isomerase-like protein
VLGGRGNSPRPPCLRPAWHLVEYEPAASNSTRVSRPPKLPGCRSRRCRRRTSRSCDASTRAWARNDMEAVFREVDNDFEWRPILGAAGVRATVYRGHDGVLAFRREVEEALGPLAIEVLAIEGFGNYVLAQARTRGRGSASGVEVSNETFHLWTMRGQKAVRLANYERRTEALEAAGLSKVVCRRCAP